MKKIILLFALLVSSNASAFTIEKLKITACDLAKIFSFDLDKQKQSYKLSFICDSQLSDASLTDMKKQNKSLSQLANEFLGISVQPPETVKLALNTCILTVKKEREHVLICDSAATKNTISAAVQNYELGQLVNQATETNAANPEFVEQMVREYGL